MDFNEWNEEILMWKKIIDYIKNKRDILYILSIILLSLFLIRGCFYNGDMNNEVIRLNNNIQAITDTLMIYRDENNRVIGEKHSYQLKQEELDDSIKKLLGKNRELVSYINTNIRLRDTIEIPTYIEREIHNDNEETGTIKFDRYDVYGKSFNEFHVSIPYSYTDSLITYPAKIDLSQNIYVEGMIERNKKNGETYIKLISDNPNLTFNSGNGILITNSSYYDKQMRKTKGIGIGIGPSIGMNYDLVNKRIIPTIGVNLTVGFTYTPRLLQW